MPDLDILSSFAPPGPPVFALRVDGVPTVASAVERDASHPLPSVGQKVWNLQSGMQRWDGAAWRQVGSVELDIRSLQGDFGTAAALHNSSGSERIYIGGGPYARPVTTLFTQGKLAVVGGGLPTLAVDGQSVFLLKFDGTDVGGIEHVFVEGIDLFDPDPAAHVGVEESHGTHFKNVLHALVTRMIYRAIGDEAIDLSATTNASVQNSVFQACAAVAGVLAGAINFNTSRFGSTDNCWHEGHPFGASARITMEAAGGVDCGYHRISTQKIDNSPAATAAIQINLGGNGPVRNIIIDRNIIREAAHIAIRALSTSDASLITRLLVLGNIVEGGGELAEAFPSLRAAIDLNVRTRRAVLALNLINDWGWAADGSRIVGHFGMMATDAIFLGNLVEAVPAHGIRMDTSDGGGVAVANRVKSVGGDTNEAGIFTASRGLVVANRIEQSYYGLNAHAADDARLLGNIVTDPIEYGLRVDGKSVAEHNTVLTAFDYALLLNGESPASIDNILRGAAVQPILDASNFQTLLGTASVTNGSAIVTGTNFFSTVADGDTLTINGVAVTVLTVDSETQLTLTANWGGATAAGLVIVNTTRRSSYKLGHLGDFVNVRSGLGRIAAGATSVTVNLRLPISSGVRLENLRLTPLQNPTGLHPWFDPATFIINSQPTSIAVRIAAAAPAGGFRFSWSIYPHPASA